MNRPCAVLQIIHKTRNFTSYSLCETSRLPYLHIICATFAVPTLSVRCSFLTCLHAIPLDYKYIDIFFTKISLFYVSFGTVVAFFRTMPFSTSGIPMSPTLKSSPALWGRKYIHSTRSTIHTAFMSTLKCAVQSITNLNLGQPRHPCRP
jgi:hypothetical protein